MKREIAAFEIQIYLELVRFESRRFCILRKRNGTPGQAWLASSIQGFGPFCAAASGFANTWITESLQTVTSSASAPIVAWNPCSDCCAATGANSGLFWPGICPLALCVEKIRTNTNRMELAGETTGDANGRDLFLEKRHIIGFNLSTRSFKIVLVNRESHNYSMHFR